MRQCKWCQRAQELSKDATGHTQVIMCRPCYRRMRRLEKLKEERRKTRTR